MKYLLSTTRRMQNIISYDTFNMTYHTYDTAKDYDKMIKIIENFIIKDFKCLDLNFKIIPSDRLYVLIIHCRILGSIPLGNTIRISGSKVINVSYMYDPFSFNLYLIPVNNESRTS